MTPSFGSRRSSTFWPGQSDPAERPSTVMLTGQAPWLSPGSRTITRWAAPEANPGADTDSAWEGTSGSVAQPARTTVRRTCHVLTPSVENLFRPELGAAQPEQQRYQQKLALLAAVINQVAADVVALQEIGGDQPLFDLQQALGGTFPHWVISNFPDAQGIRVAFLSKFAIVNAAHIVESPPVRRWTSVACRTLANRSQSRGRGTLEGDRLALRIPEADRLSASQVGTFAGISQTALPTIHVPIATWCRRSRLCAKGAALR